ncbi:MAG TPA: DUF3147 family protein [Candidatus Acidoferrales bacterium]|nr:DUF3147 family protein [Candidatus Acidoferrales bacterium]
MVRRRVRLLVSPAEVSVLIQVDVSVLRRSKWHEYAVRFFFGGLITAIAGLIAKHYGPALGGLFLAFPAIFPASVTLCQQKEIEKKKQKNLSGEQIAISAAACEAAGAVLGSIGLAAFAAFCAVFVQYWNPWFVFFTALIVWGMVSAACWFARKRWNRLREKPQHASSPLHPRGQ